MFARDNEGVFLDRLERDASNPIEIMLLRPLVVNGIDTVRTQRVRDLELGPITYCAGMPQSTHRQVFIHVTWEFNLRKRLDPLSEAANVNL